MASKFLIASFALYQQQSLRLTSSELAEVDSQRKAICIMESQPNEVGKGVVNFTQAGAHSLCEIRGVFSGLAPGKKHGFHIHQYGNLLQGCTTAGPHYNPFGHSHAGPASLARHVGDLGNVLADDLGNGKYNLLDHQVNLYGPYSVVGRSCVLHRNEDDLGLGENEESKKTGNAGARIACGVIGLASE